MPDFTDKETRRKALATRRRNASFRKERNAKLGYNFDNPRVTLTNNVVVTKAVQKRLYKKADTSTPLSILEILLIAIIFVSIINFFLISPFTIANLILLIPPVISMYIFTTRRRQKLESKTGQLAMERKELIDERHWFYTSPEWRQVRSEVIKKNGNACSECGLKITNKIDITVDHIRPRSKYPELCLDKANLRVLCRSCNSQKGDSDSEIFA